MANKRIIRSIVAVGALGLLSVLIGFMGGWLASRHLILNDGASRIASVPRGNAPQDVRAAVLKAIADFQKGYTARDVEQAGPFVNNLFLPVEDILVLGTEPGEWIAGRDRVQRFITADWARWGDVTLDVESTKVSVSNDVAWLATTGKVRFDDSTSPIRFTGVLVRRDEQWFFTQMQFQWDRRGPTFRELLRPRNLTRLSWQ